MTKRKITCRSLLKKRNKIIIKKENEPSISNDKIYLRLSKQQKKVEHQLFKRGCKERVV